MSEVVAVAKAVEETAKLGRQALETSERAGGFIAKVFKEPIEECAGMLTDHLKHKRWLRLT
jgi:hypothetical protein